MALAIDEDEKGFRKHPPGDVFVDRFDEEEAESPSRRQSKSSGSKQRHSESPPSTITTTQTTNSGQKPYSHVVPSNVEVPRKPSNTTRASIKNVVVVSGTPPSPAAAEAALEAAPLSPKTVGVKTVTSSTSRTSDTTGTSSTRTPSSSRSTTVSVEDQISAVTKSLVRLDLISDDNTGGDNDEDESIIDSDNEMEQQGDGVTSEGDQNLQLHRQQGRGATKTTSASDSCDEATSSSHRNNNSSHGTKSHHSSSWHQVEYDREDSAPSLPGALMYMQNRYQSATSFSSLGSGGGVHIHAMPSPGTCGVRRKNSNKSLEKSFSTSSLSTVSSGNLDEADDEGLSRTSSSSSLLSRRGCAEDDTDESTQSLTMPSRRRGDKAHRKQDAHHKEVDQQGLDQKKEYKNKPLLLSSSSASSLYHSDVPIPPPSALSSSSLGIAAILSNIHQSERTLQEASTTPATAPAIAIAGSRRKGTSNKSIVSANSSESSVGVVIDIYGDEDTGNDSSLSYDSSPVKARRRRRDRERKRLEKQRLQRRQYQRVDAAGRVFEATLASSSSPVIVKKQHGYEDAENDENIDVINGHVSTSSSSNINDDDGGGKNKNHFNGTEIHDDFDSGSSLWHRISRLSSRSLKYTAKSIRSLVSQNSGLDSSDNDNKEGAHNVTSDIEKHAMVIKQATIAPPAVAFSYVVSPHKDSKSSDDGVPLVDENFITPLPLSGIENTNGEGVPEANAGIKRKKKKFRRRQQQRETPCFHHRVDEMFQWLWL